MLRISGNTQVSALDGEFYTVWCNTVDHVQSSGPLNASEMCLRIFGDLWWFMIPSKTWQLPVIPSDLHVNVLVFLQWGFSHLSQLCPIRRDGSCQCPSPWRGRVWLGLQLSQFCRGEFWGDKKHYAAFAGSAFFIGLFPYLAQNTSWSLWWWVCTPLHMGVTLHSQQSTLLLL